MILLDFETCYFCKKTRVRDRAVEEGWVPYFYTPDGKEICEPACPPCTVRNLTLGPDGEWEQSAPAQ